MAGKTLHPCSRCSTCIVLMAGLRQVWCAAVVNSKAGPGNGKLYTEEDWNTESSVADEPYRYSKVRRVLL